MSFTRITTLKYRSPVLPLAVALVFLSGCAVPPAVTVASLVADGVSYATTGKSTTDHAISAILQEDCAVLRAVQGDEICDPDGEDYLKQEQPDESEQIVIDHGDFHLQHKDYWGLRRSTEKSATRDGAL